MATKNEEEWPAGDRTSKAEGRVEERSYNNGRTAEADEMFVELDVGMVRRYLK